MLHGDGRTVYLSLDQRIGAAFALQDLYLHGFFSASIKLPSDYVARVVVAFYGCRKRLRRIKVRDKGSAAKSGVRRGIASRNVCRIADQESPLHPPLYPLRSESAGSENHNSRSVSSSPDKDDHCYTTRGSAALVCEGENADERASAASLPRFFVSLSNKEKEEDFMVMKGCKLPQRPKKRSKFVQKCILISHRREEKRIKGHRMVADFYGGKILLKVNLYVRADLVVASAGDDKKISLWNKNGQSMGSFPSHVSDLADDIEKKIASISLLLVDDFAKIAYSDVTH
ncbi:hypothetical protein ZIOFF_040116 [Zingiber officinale]|uniref:Uncharacterized protein n=1 Tax=Zingiber officinale TaxID=94328 RepID=A0A8J5KUV6_ZINOF|nr:hypothetical protein ZIOFF_040116 [Zingiber officinale]